MGIRYVIGFQPDWLRYVKVTRDLETGRQSTRRSTRIRPTSGRQNPETGSEPGSLPKEQKLDFEVTIADPTPGCSADPGHL